MDAGVLETADKHACPALEGESGVGDIGRLGAGHGPAAAVVADLGFAVDGADHDIAGDGVVELEDEGGVTGALGVDAHPGIPVGVRCIEVNVENGGADEEDVIIRFVDELVAGLFELSREDLDEEPLAGFDHFPHVGAADGIHAAFAIDIHAPAALEIDFRGEEDEFVVGGKVESRDGIDNAGVAGLEPEAIVGDFLKADFFAGRVGRSRRLLGCGASREKQDTG